MLDAISILLCLSCAVHATQEYNFRYAVAGGGSNGMTVSWSTLLTYSNPPMIRFGSNQSTLKEHGITVTGLTQHYYDNYHHHVTIDSLTPSTTYYFTVTSQNDTEGASPIRSFRSNPLPVHEKGVRIAIYGDMVIISFMFSSGYVFVFIRIFAITIYKCIFPCYHIYIYIYMHVCVYI